MPFTGKASYSAGATLPENAEDVSDIIGIVSPYETPLLDHLGDPGRVAGSTRHEWLEDTLLANADNIDPSQTFTLPASDTGFNVVNGGLFRIGDQLQPDGSREVLFVTNVSNNTLTVVRGYGSSTAAALSAGQVLRILGNAALEGADAPATRFTNRVRKSNYTQIFTAAVEVSGTAMAVGHPGVEDEMDYQRQERLRELIRDLENCVLNGRSPASNPQGDSSTRRTMKGIIPFLSTNVFTPGSNGFPTGTTLSEDQINAALRLAWNGSAGSIDTIVVNGMQKRRVNAFIASNRKFAGADTRYRDMVGVYESDFGVCRVILCRWMPPDSVLLLDSSRVQVLPLAGRSFYFKRFPAAGDKEAGQLIGEYTVELHNENAHALIKGLATT